MSASTEGRAGGRAGGGAPGGGSPGGSGASGGSGEPGGSGAPGAGGGERGEDAGSAGGRRYGRGAAVLSVGIGVTGLVTYAYFSLASHALDPADYGGITLLWSAVFITVAILYRPVEQLLSRTIADHDARGVSGSRALRIAAAIQLALGLVFAILALLFREPLEEDLLGGSATLYWVLLVAVLAYAASYFARGLLAGHGRFGLYGALVLAESVSRCLFAVAVVVGIASGQATVALGIAAAPVLSLTVVPWALGRRLRGGGRGRAPAIEPEAHAVSDDREGSWGPGEAAVLDSTEAIEPRAEGTSREAEFTLAHGGGFAAAVLVVMVAEQTFMNAGPLLVMATEGSRGAALAGFAFNVLLVARAPLQLFQAVQTSILPHLTRLRAGGEADPFRRSINLTLAAIAVFAALVALVMLALGPALMALFFGADFDYTRGGLVLVAVGMGLYLAAATLNQAALARAQARSAAACWAAAAVAFVAFLLVARFDDRVLQVEIAFLGGAALLCLLLGALYRRGEHPATPAR